MREWKGKEGGKQNLALVIWRCELCYVTCGWGEKHIAKCADIY